MAVPALNDPVMRPKVAAETLGVSEATLAKWRMRNYGPIFYRLGHRTIVYRRSAIERWLGTRECGGDCHASDQGRAA